MCRFFFVLSSPLASAPATIPAEPSERVLRVRRPSSSPPVPPWRAPLPEEKSDERLTRPTRPPLETGSSSRARGRRFSGGWRARVAHSVAPLDRARGPPTPPPPPTANARAAAATSREERSGRQSAADHSSLPFAVYASQRRRARVVVVVVFPPGATDPLPAPSVSRVVETTRHGRTPTYLIRPRASIPPPSRSRRHYNIVVVD